MQIALVKEGKFDKPDMIFKTGEILSLNGTNTKTLVRAYGPDSDAWIDKEIELRLGQVEFQKKLQDSVVIKTIIAADSHHREGGSAVKMTEMNDEIPF